MGQLRGGANPAFDIDGRHHGHLFGDMGGHWMPPLNYRTVSGSDRMLALNVNSES